MEWIWTEDLLLSSHISWLTMYFWESATSQNPLGNKPCSSWMKGDGILKVFHMDLPSGLPQYLSLQRNTAMILGDYNKICCLEKEDDKNWHHMPLMPRNRAVIPNLKTLSRFPWFFLPLLTNSAKTSGLYWNCEGIHGILFQIPQNK